MGKVRKFKLRKMDFPEVDTVWVKSTVAHVKSEKLDDWLRYNSPPYLVQPKYDGERAMIMKHGTSVFLVNRRKTIYKLPKEIKDKIIRAFGRKSKLIVDGEYAAKDDEFSSFMSHRLLKDKDDIRNVVFHAFDLIWYEGLDLRSLPLKKRMEMLRKLTKENDFVRLVKGKVVKDKDGILRVFRDEVKRGREGVVIKPLDSKYVDDAWLKLKRKNTLDVAVIGIYKKAKLWKEERIPSSFLIGLYDKKRDEWVAIGRVSSGLSYREKSMIGKLVDDLKVDEDENFIYLSPYFVLEVEYQEVTKDGSLRAPRIKRMRFDKSPEETYRDYRMYEREMKK